jgi:hypothetical protein
MGIDPREVMKKGAADLEAEALKRQEERTQRAKETRARRAAAQKAKGPLAAGVPYTERKQDQNVALEAPTSRAEPLLAAAGSGPRVKITIRGIRVRLLDPDNFISGCKAIVDGLVRSGIAPGDSAQAIQEGSVGFHYEQQLCTAFSKEATEIEIELEDRPHDS